ncbi:MAG TPA: hypothetical protein VHT51_08340, partial [Micropepsaceae bacterium]|nr:hypothetical protein [Micropepsaceae bacterium]
MSFDGAVLDVIIEPVVLHAPSDRAVKPTARAEIFLNCTEFALPLNFSNHSRICAVRHIPSHGAIRWAIATFGRDPVDVLRRVFDVAGFAMHAIGRIDYKARGCFAASHNFEHPCRAIEAGGLAVARQVLGDR